MSVVSSRKERENGRKVQEKSRVGVDFPRVFLYYYLLSSPPHFPPATSIDRMMILFLLAMISDAYSRYSFPLSLSSLYLVQYNIFCGWTAKENNGL